MRLLIKIQTSHSQTFHTPSFGDEEFDIPVELQPSYQMHNDIGSLMGNQQTNAYGQHQWHQQSATGAHSIMTNQTYQANNYHPLSGTNQQMVMMQHQPVNHHATVQQTSSEILTSPQQLISNVGNNYIGPTASSPHATAVNSNENGSTSDESDDNDPNVSKKYLKTPSSPSGFVLQFQCYD